MIYHLLLLAFIIAHSILTYSYSFMKSYHVKSNILTRIPFERKEMKFYASLDSPPSTMNTNNNNWKNVFNDLDLSDALEKSAEIAKEESEENKHNFEPTFLALSNNNEFLSEYFQKKPYYFDSTLNNIQNAFTMDDVKESVENDFLEAGRGTFDDNRGGWNMAAVSTPRGSSFEDAKLRFQDVETALQQKSGTVVFNSAGGFIPKVALINLQFLQAFDMPCATNMYLTATGQSTSAPPHTDKQDVFVFQTQGAKRWRVYAPPPPSRMSKADPFARGKSTDKLDLAELNEPLIDTVLSPGQILYVPAGFPHTTDTIEKNVEAIGNGDASVHLTIGLDSHIWYLNYAMLRELCLKRAGVEDKMSTINNNNKKGLDRLNKLETNLYWSLQDCLPVGIFADEVINESGTAGLGPAMRRAQLDAIVNGLIQRMRDVEPNRWESNISNDVIAAELEIYEAAERIIQHHEEITTAFGKMYADVGMKLTPVQMDLSFFRSRPYLESLENIMNSLIEWSNNGSNSNNNNSNIDNSSSKKIKKQKKKTKKGNSGGGFGK